MALEEVFIIKLDEFCNSIIRQLNDPTSYMYKTIVKRKSKPKKRQYFSVPAMDSYIFADPDCKAYMIDRLNRELESTGYTARFDKQLIGYVLRIHWDRMVF
jgi:hypothetical protein